MAEDRRRDRRDDRGGARRDDRRAGPRPDRGRSSQRSRTAPAERPRSGDPARLTAYTLLRAVDDGAYANLELPHILRRGRLSGRDAAFATELGFGTIRWSGLYDRFVERAADRPVDRLDPGVRDTLRLGAHQLFGMRVPEHAAADQTVALARQVNGAGAAGLVNAVMRRLTEASREEWVARVTPEGIGTVERLALEQSHPEWVAKALRQALIGHGTASADTADSQLEAHLVADNDPPAVTLVARPGRSTVAELLEQGATPTRFSPIGAVLPGGAPGDLAEVRDGRAAVQDEGSQLVALALAAVDASVSGSARGLWLDLCSGPGGKAGVLAGLAEQSGAHLTATEVSPNRADLVRSSLRTFPDVEVVTRDGRGVGSEEPQAFERVLVDAPCSGLGALRRRPEARWRRQPGDLATLGPLQRELLASAIDATAPGGVVAYATCSPHIAETRFVVGDVTRKRSDVEVVDARPVLKQVTGGRITDLGDGPTVQLWPHLHGTDGMFLALLRKH